MGSKFVQKRNFFSYVQYIIKCDHCLISQSTLSCILSGTAINTTSYFCRHFVRRANMAEIQSSVEYLNSERLNAEIKYGMRELAVLTA